MQGESSSYCVGHRTKLSKLKDVLTKANVSQETSKPETQQVEASLTREIHLLCFDKKHLYLASSVCLSVYRSDCLQVSLSSKRSHLRLVDAGLSGYICGAPIVQNYSGQASGQVLQYRCTMKLYSTITGPCKVCALVYTLCRSIWSDLSRACLSRRESAFLAMLGNPRPPIL